MRLILLVALLGCFASTSCSNDGTVPPLGRLNFPTSIAANGNSLFVANSNFTLKYATGSLQRYDLGQAVQALVDHCGARPAAERDLCGVLPEADPAEIEANSGFDVIRVPGVLTSEVLLGSYVSGMSVAPTASGVRLYMPVRSDANISVVDVDGSGCMSCGDNESSCDLSGNVRHECSTEFREADTESAGARDIVLPADPVGITVGDATTLGGPEGLNYVVSAHRGGRASLFIDDPTSGTGPVLVDTLEGLPSELVAVTIDPLTRTAWMPNALEPVVTRVGIALESSAVTESSFLFDAGSLLLSGVDTGNGTGDTRAIALDPRTDVRRAYVLSRRPRALMVIDLDEDERFLEVRDLIEVGVGPSRLVVQRFEARDRTIAFVSCFDSRDVYVLDVDLGRLVGIVRGLGGAFELASSEVDVGGETREVLVVSDFSNSIIRVLDLDPMFECLDDMGYEGETDRECSPEPLGFIGQPNARRELI